MSRAAAQTGQAESRAARDGLRAAPEAPALSAQAPGLAGESDEQLAERARAGSREAFGEIVERYHVRLRSFLLRRTGGSMADAEDAAQEAFIRAWQRIGTYRAGRPLRPWLFTIAAREAAQGMQREAQLAQRARRAGPERQRRAQEAEASAVRLRPATLVRTSARRGPSPRCCSAPTSSACCGSAMWRGCSRARSVGPWARRASPCG